MIQYIIVFILFILPLIFGGNRFYIIYPINFCLTTISLYVLWFNNSKYRNFNNEIASVVSLPRNDSHCEELATKQSNLKYKILEKNIYYLILSFVTLVFISIFNSINIYSSINTILVWSGAFCAFYISFKTFELKNYFIINIIIWCGTIQVIIGLLQLINILPHGFWNPKEFMAGTFVNHNHFAGFLEITFPLSVTILICKFNKINFIHALFQFTGVVLSCSRAGLIALMIAFLLIFADPKINKIKTIIIYLLIILSLLLLIFLNNDLFNRFNTFNELNLDSSFNSRILIWKSTISIIKDHLITGSGIGTFQDIFPIYRPPNLSMFVNHAHNEYLELMAETGLFPIFIIIFLAIYFIYRGIKVSLLDNPVSFALSISICSLMIHGMTDFNLRIPALQIYLAVLTGIVINLNHERIYK